MEVRTDATIARDLCLAAMISYEDLETRRSLWKAALKYHRREREGLEDLTPRAGHAHTVGLVGDLRVFSE